MTELPSELRTLVERYGTRVLEDADGLRATLDDFLDEGTAAPGDVNLLTDAVRFGSLERLKTLLDQGAEPSAATADVAGALAQRRGGDAESAYWACAVLGYAADLLPGDLIPGTWMVPSSQVPPSQVPPSQVPPSQVPPSQVPPSQVPPSQVSFSQSSTGATSAPARNQGAEVTDASGQFGLAPFDDGNVTQQPGGGFSSVDTPSNGSDQHDSRPARSSKPWALVAGGFVAAALLAVGVGAVLNKMGDAGGGATDSGHVGEAHDVPIAHVLPDFDHFGTAEAFGAALQPDCVDAALPGTAPNFRCSFADTYGDYEVEFTEKDPKAVNSNGQLPEFVTNPPARTIVTIQSPSEDSASQHAYYMHHDSSGVDAENPDDDEVSLTLYDVDPQHPGAAIFTTENSGSDPLTREKADQLLGAIGSDTEKFPLPVPFQAIDLASFAEQFRDSQQKPACDRAFSQLRGETEHVTCQDENITIDFGFMADTKGLNKATYKYSNQGENSTWTSDTARGELIISRRGPSTRLFWSQESLTAWGLLTTRDRDGGEMLLDYFKGFQNVSAVSPTRDPGPTGG